MKTSNQTWSEYLASKDIRPKQFTVTLERDRSGNYTVVGHKTKMLDVVNQHESNWVQVDSRNFLSALRNAEVTVA